MSSSDLDLFVRPGDMFVGRTRARTLYIILDITDTYYIEAMYLEHMNFEPCWIKQLLDRTSCGLVRSWQASKYELVSRGDP